MKKIDLAGLLVFLSINSYFTGTQENIAISSIPIWLLAIALSLFAYSAARNTAKASLISGKARFAVLMLLISITLSSSLSDSPLTERILGSSQRGDGLTNYVALILIFVGMIQLDIKSKVRLIDWVLFAGIFQALVGFAQILGLEIFNRIGYEGVTGTLRNTNTSGFFLALLATISFSRAIDQSAGKKFQAAYFVLYGIFVFQAVLTKTIQGPVLTVAGTLGLVSIFVYERLKQSKLKTFTRIFPWSIVFTSVLATFLIYPQLLKIETFRIRTLYWHAAWDMFLVNPILGVGPGSFGSFVSEYRSMNYVKTLGPNLRVDDAHNVFLHLLSTLGIVSALIVFVCILVILISALKKLGDKVQNTSLVVVLIFLLGSAISYFNPILILVFIIFLGALHSPNEAKNQNRLLRIQIATVGIIFVTLIGFAFVTISQTHVPERLTQSEAKALLVDASLRCESRTPLLTKAIGGGIQLSEQDIESVYLSDVRCIEIGIALARRDTLENRSTAPSAINRVLELDPNNPVILGLKALVADKSNDSVSAKKLIEKANSIRDLATIGDFELSKQFLELLAK